MYLTEQNKFSIFTDQTNVFDVKLMTIMKDIKQGVSWKVGSETLIWSSLLMPEMSGKFKSNPTKINNLIYILKITQ